MNKYISAVLLLSCLMAGCRLKSDSGELPVIDVAGNLGTYRQMSMSEFISDVEYIQLETGKESMIASTGQFIVTDTRIFVESQNQCYAFTREGKFISQIGRKGRGPGEWDGIIYGLSLDEENEIIYIETYLKLFEYSWDGKFMREIKKPISGNEFYMQAVSAVSFLRENLFLGHINNNSGKEPHNWVIFDDEGKIVKAFDNHIRIEKDRFVDSAFGSSMPVMASGNTYVKERINDTLYCLDKRHELVPKFVFDLGKYAFPLDIFIARENTDIHFNTITLSNSIVFRDVVLFSFAVGKDTGIQTPRGITKRLFIMGQETDIDDSGTVQGLYDIRSGKTELLDRDPVSRRLGLVNDIDGGMSFWPKYYNDSGNELVQVLEAYEMKETLTDEYFEAHPAKNPEAHEKLRSLLKNLDENDNPVVVIAKLKK